jgi:hypothetical protein
MHADGIMAVRNIEVTKDGCSKKESFPLEAGHAPGP